MFTIFPPFTAVAGDMQGAPTNLQGVFRMIEDRDELKHEAERAGLTNLNDQQLAQFSKAKASAERLVSGIPRDLYMYDEPAHTFRANEEV